MRVMIGTRHLLCWGSLFFLAIVIKPNMAVRATNETVQLTAADYGPTNDQDPLVVTFCQNENYTIILECRVTSRHSLIWSSPDPPFKEKFTPSNDICDNRTTMGFTFLLIENDDMGDLSGESNLYISQLRVNTSTLSHIIPTSGQLNVTCKSSAKETRMKFIQISGGSKPKILKVYQIEDENKMIILWSSNNSNIVNVTVNLESNGNITHFPVDWYNKGAIVEVPDPKGPYNFTVIEYNKCRESFASDKFLHDENKSAGYSTTHGVVFIVVSLLVSYANY